MNHHRGDRENDPVGRAPLALQASRPLAKQDPVLQQVDPEHRQRGEADDDDAGDDEEKAGDADQVPEVRR